MTDPAVVPHCLKLHSKIPFKNYYSPAGDGVVTYLCLGFLIDRDTGRIRLFEDWRRSNQARLWSREADPPVNLAQDSPRSLQLLPRADRPPSSPRVLLSPTASRHSECRPDITPCIFISCNLPGSQAGRSKEKENR